MIMAFVFFWLFLIFLFLEMFLVGAVLFISIATGFLALALATLLFSPAIPSLLLLWLVVSFFSSVLIKSVTKSGKYSKTGDPLEDTNVIGMVGQSCTVTKVLAKNCYVVLFRFEEWSASPDRPEIMFKVGDVVRIVRVVGNRVVIRMV